MQYYLQNLFFPFEAFFESINSESVPLEAYFESILRRNKAGKSVGQNPVSIQSVDDPTPITRVTGPGGTATGSASATISTNTSMSISNSQFVNSFIQAY